MPTPPLDPWKRTEFLRRLISGVTRDEAVEGLMSAGEGSKIREEFIQYVEDSGLTAAGKHYDIRTELDQMFDRSQEMRRLNVTVKNLDIGIEFFGLLDHLDIEHDLAPEILAILRSASQSGNPLSYLNAANELDAAERKWHIPFVDAVPKYTESVKKLVRIADEERQKTKAAEEKEREKTRKETEFEREQSAKDGEEERKKTDEHVRRGEKRVREAESALGLLNDELSRANRELGKTQTALDGIGKETESSKSALAKARSKLAELNEERKETLRKGEWATRTLRTLRRFGVKDLDTASKLVASLEHLGSTGKIVRLLKRYASLEYAITDCEKSLEQSKARFTQVKQQIEAIHRAEREEQAKLRLVIKQTAKAEGVGANMEALRRRLSERSHHLGKLVRDIGAREVDVAELERDFIELRAKRKAALDGLGAVLKVQAGFDTIEERLRQARLECKAELREMRRRMKDEEEMLDKKIDSKNRSLSELDTFERSEKKRVQRDIQSLQAQRDEVAEQKTELEQGMVALDTALAEIERELFEHKALRDLEKTLAGRPIDFASYANLADTLLAGVASGLDSGQRKGRAWNWTLLGQIRGLQKQLRRLSSGGQ